MVGRSIILYIRGAGVLLRKGAPGEGESGVPEEVPPQAPSLSRPCNNGPVIGRRSRHAERRSYAIPKREDYEGGPRRAAERSEGPKVEVGPRGGCRLDLASRADPASEDSQSPLMRFTGRTTVARP